jgi:hypothetical protein
MHVVGESTLGDALTGTRHQRRLALYVHLATHDTPLTEADLGCDTRPNR